MSAVLLRCPHCGTTQASPGECEACHEGEVRPFCPNHTPGRWLDGPTCPECGAAIGRDRPTPPRAPPRVSPRYRREAPRDPLGRTPREAPREPPPREPEPMPREPMPGEPEPPRRRDPFGTPYTPPRESPGAAEWPPPPAWRPEPPPPTRPPREERTPPVIRISVFGCLGRLVAAALVILVLLALAFFWLFGAGGGGFSNAVVDFGRQVGVVEGTPDQTARGVAAFRAGDHERAERELREAAQAYPRSGVALVYLARIQRMRRDEAGALESLEEAVRREPALAIAHRELAAVHFARGQRLVAEGASDYAVVAAMTTAERHFARAAEVDPADRTARGYRACALAALGREGEAATELLAAGDGPWTSCARGGR